MVSGIFTPNESTTFGMLQALKKSGVNRKVKFYGFDSSDKLVAALRDGDIDGLVVQNPFNMGYLAVKTMTEHLRGKPVEKRIDTGARLVEKEQLDDPAVKEMLSPESREVARGVTGAEAAPAVLALAGIEKAFGAVSVLRGIDLDVRGGEVHAVLGENGAGKSTLMRILLGAESADRGQMKLAGEPYAPKSPGDARRAGVVMVPQERTLCLHLTVLENVVLGLEPHAAGFLRRGEARAIAERALGLVMGVGRRDPARRARRAAERRRPAARRDRPRARPGRRGRRRVRRTGASRGHVQGVLVLDEPTSSLGHDDAARLFTRVHALKAAGLAIVLVTHFLGDVRAHADRYTVLRDGKVQGTGDPNDTPPEQMSARCSDASSRSKARRPKARRRVQRREGASSGQDDAVLLDVNGLGGRERPRSASFVLRRGEVLGIAGLVGSGRTELLRLDRRPRRARAGRTSTCAPTRASASSARIAAARGSCSRGRSRRTSRSRSAARSWRCRAQVLADGARWIDELSIKASGPSQAAGELSGGNQQKVQIARLLREDYDVLLVDEPTRGIDVASKAQVLALVRDPRAQREGDRPRVQLSSTSSFRPVIASPSSAAASSRRRAPRSEWTEEQLLLEASS